MDSRVLIVEDEPMLRRSLAAYLVERGLHVREAASLAEAREELARGAFDLLVLDVGLPDGDGLELLEPGRAARALVVSAAPDPGRYARRGVLHHLAKPLDLTTVLDRLHAIRDAA